MKVIVVYAHPGTDGFSSTMLERVKADLEERGIEHEIWDLYKIGYDPVLKKEEVYTAGNRKVSDENLKFQEKIGEASKLIFIYPVWWGGMPAILKGFIDRVF
ncbi:MAG: NAD(P)H-dependent oxidoreductase, partial [Candidatus Paceibacterota bacterium]